jgi:hypothetical protein
LNKKSESKVQGSYTEVEGASGVKLAESSIIDTDSNIKDISGDQNRAETYSEEGKMDSVSEIAEVVGEKDNQANNVPLKDLEVADGSIGSSLIDGLTKADDPGEVTPL